MKHKLLGSCLKAYLIFLAGSFLAALFLTPTLVQNYVPAVVHADASGVYNAGHAIALQNVCYILLCIVFLLSLIPLIVFWFKFYRPLTKITEAASKYTDGNEPAPDYTYTTDDELGRLAASVNYLANSVHNSGQNQREFVSNISHDLRSPLTSIKGYLEAILDGTIPPEAQQKYLQIVADETTRLTSLTEELLTLNTFDDQGVFLKMTDFNITPVIYSIIASLEGRCQKKNLRIDLSPSSREVYVHADKEQIQRVLYNLLDNAVKFSYNDSFITVTLSRRRNLIFVSVKDNGEGIEKENLPRIWERFYKTDASRGRYKKGTGLGLPIVREIIRAHEQNINVISTKDVGTEFVFSLAKGKPGF